MGDADSWLALVAAAGAAGIPARVLGTMDWDAFRVAAPLAECTVVLMTRMPRDVLVRADHPLRVLLDGRPYLPVVFATDGRPPLEALHMFQGRGDFVRFPLDARAVWDAAQRAATRALLSYATTRFASTTTLPPRLGNALARACGPAHAAHTVASCAEVVGCHRRTMWREWRSVGLKTLALEDVLRWIVVLHACALHGPRRTWRAVALRLGIDRGTLARTVTDTLGVPLREMSTHTHREARLRFASRILVPLWAHREEGSSGARAGEDELRIRPPASVAGAPIAEEPRRRVNT